MPSHCCSAGHNVPRPRWLSTVRQRDRVHSSGQFIGRPQTFVELQSRFKLHFYTKKMQFETKLELHKRLWTTNELTAVVVLC